MFCRFCGNEIPNDSSFCEHCGSNLFVKNVQTSKGATRAPAPTLKKKSCHQTSFPIQLILDLVNLAGIVFFVFSFGKMAPGWGIVSIISYVIFVSLYIWLTSMLRKRARSKNAQNNIILFLAFVCTIAVSFVSLTAIYNSKVERVLNSRPSDGEVKVQVSLLTDFYTYSEYGSKIAYDPSAEIKIGDKWYDSGSVVSLKLNEPYSIELCCSANHADAFAKGSINFGFDDLLEGYSISRHVSNKLWMFSAEVTAKFVRVVDFWEVIFY